MSQEDLVWAVDAAGTIWTVGAQDATNRVESTGVACDISIGADATAWVIAKTPDNNTVIQSCKVDVRNWSTITVPFAPVNVAGAPDGTVWAISDKGEVWHVQPSAEAVLAGPAGLATQISIGTDGTIWICNPQQRADDAVKRYDGRGQWLPVPMHVMPCKIAGMPDETFSMIDADGRVYSVDAASGAMQALANVTASEISGGADGTVWILSTDTSAGSTSEVIKLFDVVAGDWRTLASTIVPRKLAGNCNLNPAWSSPAEQEHWTAPSRIVPRWTATDKYDPNQSTHLWIVCRAAEVARSQKRVGEAVYDWVKPSARRGDDPVHDRICEGLWDADEVDPYRNSVLPGDTWYGKLLATYKSHFYDSTTGKNWLGETDPTALTEGVKFFRRALDQYWAGYRDLAGYSLGLSLHYLTDLTQPMHSANFTNVSSNPWMYHGAFEDLAIRVMGGVAINQSYRDNPNVNPEDYLKAAATASRPRNARVCSYRNLQAWKSAVVELLYPWEDAVKPDLEGALQDAVTITSQYLVLWMALAQGSSLREPVLATLGQPGDVPVPGDYLGSGDILPTIWRGVQPNPQPGSQLKYVGLKALNSKDTWSVYYNTTDSVPVPATYFVDGDAQPGLDYPLQPAVWRTSNGMWRLIPIQGSETYFSQLPPAKSARAVPARYGYRNNRLTQPATWDPESGLWSVRASGFEEPVGKYVLGQKDDIPVPCDFTGSGRATPAIWRPSDGTWHISPGVDANGEFITSQSPLVKQWGTRGDVPVPADYLGLGYCQLAVWRPSTGTWFILPVSAKDSSESIQVQFGHQGDVPVPEQYERLGYARPAIWRPSDGTWRLIPGGEQIPFNQTVRPLQCFRTNNVNGNYYRYTTWNEMASTLRQQGWYDEGIVGHLLADSSNVPNAVPVYVLVAISEPGKRFELVFSDAMLASRQTAGWAYIEMCGYLLPEGSGYEQRPDVVPVYWLSANAPNMERTYLVFSEEEYNRLAQGNLGWAGWGKVGYMFVSPIFMPQLRIQSQ